MVLGGWGMVVLVGRLFWLTVVEGESARVRADSNRVEIRRLAAPRGVIYDRNEEKLVINIPGETEGEIKRKYVYGEALAHILGYVGEVSQEEIAQVRNLEPGDIMGKMGVERVGDERLRGVAGAELVETGASGEVLRRLGRREPVSGEEVELTIDAGLQKRVYEILDHRVGVVVVTEVETGQVLALVSSPSFNPEAVENYLVRADEPLFNRAVGGVYPPGSVFKLVTAVAGLEEGKISGETEIEDTGEIKIGEFRYGNWYFDQYGRKEGWLNIVRALGRSNDIFFYRVGQMVGPMGLADWGRRLGLGQEVGWGLGGEAMGLVPDPEWKEKIKGERWFLGNTYHLAIGQGDIGVTPMQINLLTAAMATGRLCRPEIVPSVKSKAQNCENIKISQKTLTLVRQGMAAACAAGGTAFPLFNFSPAVGCKTGTAQHGGEGELPHAWITILAPIEKPEIALTVLLEAAGEGSYQAAPVAREILEYWFHERRGSSG